MLLAGALALLAGCEPSREALIEQHQATVGRYCTSCHDDIERTADLSLKSLPSATSRRTRPSGKPSSASCAPG